MNGLEILGKGNFSEESFPFPKSTRVESATPFPKFFVPIESPFTILSEAGCLWNTLFESGNTLPSHPSPPNPFDFFPFFSESMSPFHTRPILKKHTLEWARRLGETRKSALASSPFRLAPVPTPETCMYDIDDLKNLVDMEARCGLPFTTPS